MEKRKFVIGGIAVASVVLLGIIGSLTVPNLIGPQAPSRGEVKRMVERVHGDVDMVDAKSSEMFVGIDDVSEYTFKDKDGIEFTVRAGVMEGEEEIPVVHDMWADAYLDAKQTRELIEKHGGAIQDIIETGSNFVNVPRDTEEGDVLKKAMAKAVPEVPEDLMGVYYMLNNWTFNAVDGEGNMMTTDVFGYIGQQ